MPSFPSCCNKKTAMPSESIRSSLEQGLEILDIPLTVHQINQLLQFVDLLLIWNRRVNLTAIYSGLEIVEKHLLDCLLLDTILKTKERIADLGSGAGLPAIIAAILRYESEILSVDARHKKIAFQQQAKRRLGLENLYPISQRVEDCCDDRWVQRYLARAFKDPENCLKMLAGMAVPQTLATLMLGPNSYCQALSIQNPCWQLTQMRKFVLPFSGGLRYIGTWERVARSG